MFIAQNVFQGFAVAYFWLQILTGVGLFFVAASTHSSFVTWLTLIGNRVWSQFAKSLKLIWLLSSIIESLLKYRQLQQYHAGR